MSARPITFWKMRLRARGKPVIENSIDCAQCESACGKDQPVADSSASNRHFSACSRACARRPRRLAGLRERTSGAAITTRPAGVRCHSKSDPCRPPSRRTAERRRALAARCHATARGAGVKHRNGLIRDNIEFDCPICTSSISRYARARYWRSSFAGLGHSPGARTPFGVAPGYGTAERRASSSAACSAAAGSRMSRASSASDRACISATGRRSEARSASPDERGVEPRERRQRGRVGDDVAVTRTREALDVVIVGALQVGAHRPRRRRRAPGRRSARSHAA